MPGPGGMPPGHGIPPQGPPGPPGGPAPHVNPAFFQQGPSHQGPPGPPHGPAHGPAPHNYGPPAQVFIFFFQEANLEFCIIINFFSNLIRIDFCKIIIQIILEIS